MANAIPLSAPDGTVYAYACGVCHHVRASLSAMGPCDVEGVTRIAETNKPDAERCCRCERCETVAGPFSFLSANVCPTCLPAHEAEKTDRDARIAAHYERSDRIQAERMRLSKDETSARALAALMSEISEECYCAGWMSGLEFSLWAMVQGGDRSYGMSEPSESEVAQLRALSERCGGWIRWEEDVGEVFVPLHEWEQTYGAKGDA